MARAPTTPAAKKPAAKKPARSVAPKPARPKGLAHGRWLGDFPDLSPAEQLLVECCARGEIWKPVGWDWERPEAASVANTIRAELIRFLALGGDDAHPVHEEGVMVRGAWVAGTLNLHQGHAKVRLDLQSCRFDEAPSFTAARIPELVLSGSKVPGLSADRIKVTGGVFLDEDFAATGEVRLLGAEIGRSLACIRSTFDNPDGRALSADGIKIGGDIFFKNGFDAKGEIRLLGAEIGGNLECTSGAFSNGGKRAISADGIKVAGTVFLLGARIEGAVDFFGGRISTLNDDEVCWSAGGHILDGLRYDRIVGKTDADSRIQWLERQQADQLDNRNWSPQPWEQLIKTLRDMGHPLEATKVAIAKQERMRRAGKVGGWLARLLHRIYGRVAGYGYRPIYTVGWMVGMWLAAALCFHLGSQAGYIGPTTPLYNSPALSGQVEQKCGHGGESGKTPWTRCPAMPAEYTTFQPLMYSLDLILPLVDLQQEADWAPIVEDPPGNTLPFGAFLRWLMWFEILFGWAMSLMLVAVLGKLVNKD